MLGDQPGVEVTALDRAGLDITDADAVAPPWPGTTWWSTRRPGPTWTAPRPPRTRATAVNGDGRRQPGASLRRDGRALLHVSTDYVFPGDAQAPYPEDAPTAPINAYGRGKLVGEAGGAGARCPSAATSCAPPGSTASTAATSSRTMLRLAAHQDTLDVVDDQRGQPTWSFALAARLVELGARRAGRRRAPAGVYHGTASGETTWFGLARAVFAEAGLDPERVQPTTSDRFPRPARRPGYSVLGHDRWAAAGLQPLAGWRETLAAALKRPGFAALVRGHAGCPVKVTVAALTSPNLRGPLAVGIGSAVLGASGYAFLTLTAGAVSVADYAAVASLYLLVALVGPGLFVAVEQETTRLVSRWEALGHGTRDVVAQLGLLTAGLLGVVLVLLVAAEPLLVDRVFNGRTSLWFALVASVVGYAGVSLLRGVLAGRRRLVGYGAVIGVDGLARIVPCLAFAAAGVVGPAPYGLALGLGSIASLILALALVRRARCGTDALLAGVAHRDRLADRRVGSVVRSGQSRADRGHRASGRRPGPGRYVRVRVRARAGTAVRALRIQPILLPMLSRAAANRDLVGLRRALRQAGLVVTALGAVALLTTAPICQWLIGALFDHGVRLSGWVITLLAVGTILAMLVQVVQPALLRRGRTPRDRGGLGARARYASPLAFAAARRSDRQRLRHSLVAGAVTLAVMVVALRLRLRAGFAPTEGTTGAKVPSR